MKIIEVDSLSDYLKALNIKKVKAKKGKKITHIKFIFQGEDDQLENGKYRIEVGKKFAEKDPGDLTKDEINKGCPDLPKSYLKSYLKMKVWQVSLKNF